MANRTRSPTPQKSGESISSDWKSHPLAIAAGSAAAGILLCIAVVTGLVIPTQTATLNIEILKLKESRSELQDKLAAQTANARLLTSKVKALKARNTRLNSSIENLTTQLVDAKLGNFFAGDSPYPNGLGLVQVGMPFTEISKVYPSELLRPSEDTPGTITVDIKNSPIESVTYFYDEKTKEKRITHVSFDIGYFNKHPEGFLNKKLIEAYGEPTENPRPKYFRWKASSKLNIFMHNSYGYLVMRNDYAPLFWPQD